MTEKEMARMIEKAAEAGAKKALRDGGLSDDDANGVVKELRTLRDTWRITKRTAVKTIVQAVTYLFLGALITGAYLNFNGKP